MAPAPDEEPEAEASLLDDVQGLVNIVGYALRSLRRRWPLALWVFSVTATVSMALGFALPKTYRSGSRIQTSRSYIIGSLVKGRRALPSQADAPTRGVREYMRSRAFLRDLIVDTKLDQHWSAGRGPLANAKDALRTMLLGELGAADLNKALRSMLQDRIRLEIIGDVIKIEVRWWHAEMAYRLAASAQHLLLKSRQDHLLAQIDATTRILQRRLGASQDRLNRSADYLQKTIEKRAGEIRGELSVTARRKQASRVFKFRRASGANLSPEAREISDDLRRTQERIASQQRAHQRKLNAAEERLVQLKLQIGPEHPDYKQALRDLEKVLDNSIAVQTLRDEEQSLQGRLRELTSSSTEEATDSGDRLFEVVQVPMTGDVYAALVADPGVENLMNEARRFAAAHASLVERLNGAEMEAETAREAFNYRYIVTEPPALPAGPSAPKNAVIFLLALFAGGFLGFAVALAADILTQSLLEPWQMESVLGVEVLGHVKYP